MLADMIDRVNFAGVSENAGDGIIDEGVVLPAIPEPGDHVEILARPLVSLVMRRVLGKPEILRRLRGARGNDVPARATVAEMIERSKQPRQVIGFRVGR